MTGHVVALSGGVGGAKLAQGLHMALAPDELTIIVNTADDFEHLGLYISPDIDSVVYALAGLADATRGWGRRDETWTCMSALRQLGGESWFQLGDGDLAMHLRRTQQLAQGAGLGEVTEQLCQALGVTAQVVPMSDQPVRTRLLTDIGWLEFQEYFVRRQCQPVVREVRFAGAESARAHPRALAALARDDLRAVVICPSNPFVSVEPILSVPGMRAALTAAQVPVIAVTPIIGGKAIKGPAAKMMAELGLEISAEALIDRYAALIDIFIADLSDPLPQGLAGITVLQAQTLMSTPADRVALARAVLAAAAR